MTIIDDLPVEVLQHVFRLGCETNPEDWYGRMKTPVSLRTRHPFIVTAKQVCASWHGLANHQPNNHYHFTFLSLRAGNSDTGSMNGFQIYRRGLLQSNQSNIFMIIRETPESNVNSTDDWRIKLYLHTMDLTLNYKSQLRSIRANLFTTEGLASFLLFESRLESAPSIAWTLVFHGGDLATLSKFSYPSSLYFDPDCGNVAAAMQVQSTHNFHICLKGISGAAMIHARAFYLHLAYGKIDDLKTVLALCAHCVDLAIEHIFWEESDESVARFVCSSVETVKFTAMTAASVRRILSFIQFPKLCLIWIRQLTRTNINNIQLPYSVSHVIHTISTFSDIDETEWVCCFAGHPTSSIERVPGHMDGLVFGCDMASLHLGDGKSSVAPYGRDLFLSIGSLFFSSI